MNYAALVKLVKKQTKNVNIAFNRLTNANNPQQRIKEFNRIILAHNSIINKLNESKQNLSEIQINNITKITKKIENNLKIKIETDNLKLVENQELLKLFDEDEKYEEENLDNQQSITIDELSDSDSETDDLSNTDLSDTIIKKENNMGITIIEFLSLASKLLPEFDGTKENLQRFIDALQIVNSIKETHESTAVELIKTKLKGNARNIITTEATVNDIIQKLKLRVKGESVDTITAKLMNIKQQHKTANTYAKEVEDLTRSLEGAYINDGLKTEIAEKYATRAAVKAITANTNNEKVKLIIESGNFENINDVVSKFINATNDASGSQGNVLYYKRNFQQINQFRGRGRGKFNNYNHSYRQQYSNNNNNYNNFNRGRGTYNYNYQNSNNRGGLNYRPFNYRGSSSSNNLRNTRVINYTDSENEMGPVVQHVQQGDRY